MDKIQGTVTQRVDPADAGLRIDKYLAERADLTRSAAVRMLEEGDVSVSGASVSKNYKVKAGDEIEIRYPEPEPDTALPENIPLDVVYEDADIIVINKPVGMVVHPAAGNPSGTLVNALLYHCKGSLSGIGGVLRPGIVHRIDKDTSGIWQSRSRSIARTASTEPSAWVTSRRTRERLTFPLAATPPTAREWRSSAIPTARPEMPLRTIAY